MHFFFFCLISYIIVFLLPVSLLALAPPVSLLAHSHTHLLVVTLLRTDHFSLSPTVVAYNT